MKKKEKKLFAKSFIYRGQIDSLSNQSASNNEESYSFLVHPSFRSRSPFPIIESSLVWSRLFFLRVSFWE